MYGLRFETWTNQIARYMQTSFEHAQEPKAEEIGNWEEVVGKRPLNKFIFMMEPSRIAEIRPMVEERIGKSGHLTQAVENMLEVLPPDASKGFGVQQLLNSINVQPEDVLAIGDAENVSRMHHGVLSDFDFLYYALLTLLCFVVVL